MRTIVRWGLAACAAAVLDVAAGAVALANDTSAQLATGGLVLTKTDAIEMKSEDLSISEKLVHVRYVFENTSGRDASVLVAFPLPDITIEGPDDNIVVPTESPTNFLGFVTTVDGRVVDAQVEQKVIKDGVDETAYLRELGIPLAPQLPSTAAALLKLPLATQTALKAKGLAIDDDYDVGKGMEHHLQPTWTLKTTYYWRQGFPAGKPVVVDHRYRPSVGGTAGTEWGDPAYKTQPGYAQGRAKYCIDDSLLASLAQKRAAAQKTGGYYAEERIQYVLTTGANWKAPIGDFTMTIDKGSTGNLVSFCGDRVKKIGPTTFQVHYANFTPTRDVAILLLVPETFAP